MTNSEYSWWFRIYTCEYSSFSMDVYVIDRFIVFFGTRWNKLTSCSLLRIQIRESSAHLLSNSLVTLESHCNRQNKQPNAPFRQHGFARTAENHTEHIPIVERRTAWDSSHRHGDGFSLWSSRRLPLQQYGHRSCQTTW